MPNRTRPICVTFDSKSIIHEILSKREHISKDIKNLTDKTELERAYLKKVIEELKSHNLANPNNQRKLNTFAAT